MNSKKTKKLTTTGMLCALAYAAAVFGRIPLVLFLKYDSKDVIIVMGGLLFGPMTSFAIVLLRVLPLTFTERLLFSAFIPFNLMKGGLNAVLTMIFYKPVIIALQRLHWTEEP